MAGNQINFEHDGLVYSMKFPSYEYMNAAEKAVDCLVSNASIPSDKRNFILSAIKESMNRCRDANLSGVLAKLQEDTSLSSDLLAQSKISVTSTTDSAKQNRHTETSGLSPTQIHTYFVAVLQSSLVENLLNFEENLRKTYMDVSFLCKQETAELEKRHERDMSYALGSDTCSEVEINNLVQYQCEEKQLKEAECQSKLSHLAHQQRKQFCEVLDDLYKQSQQLVDNPGTNYGNLFRNRLSTRGSADQETFDNMASALDESFTISLGAQLKTMHNVRLTADDFLNFCCDSDPSVPNTSSGINVQRLETLLGLYSDALTAIVRLVHIDTLSFHQPDSKFTQLCKDLPEFHFPTFDEQWQAIQKIKSTACKTSIEHSKTTNDNKLKVGDFFITKHSNLSRVHFVIHVITDDSLASASRSDLSSRHPVIIALRDVIKVVFKHDIRTLSIPLLLIDSLSESTTNQWLCRRAELILKCLKGFLIEFSTWSRGESRTIQLLVPKEISEQSFFKLSAVLSAIFRETNVKILET